MNEKDLIEKGFTRAPDGSWSKPPRHHLDGLRNNQPQQTPRVLAPRPNGRQENHPPRLAGIRVVLTSFRARILDHDNLAGGSAKFLRDAIAKSLGRDDAESSGIQWVYQQTLTKGPKGTLAQIQRLTNAPGERPGAELK